MRLGIFGGSFDPVHNGHLALARACQQQAGLDEIWFTPTSIQPLKAAGPHATDRQRVEMLNLAIASPNESIKSGASSDLPKSATWRACTMEIDRGGRSYTIETVRQLHEELPDAELYFLLGADAARDVPHWLEPVDIFRLAMPLIVHRAGEPSPNLAALAAFCPSERPPKLVEMPPANVSSSEIRRRIAAGKPIDDLVPAAVANYIVRNSLYRAS
jgi:nicotinate-nucleotide adenylyltransferase